MNHPRPFRPTHHPGGSKPGKPHNKWPDVVLVVADAVVAQVKGDTWASDRRSVLPEPIFRARVARLLPGVWEWLDAHHGPVATPRSRLLLNRIYKMHYNGTSARGRDHDPATRASTSREHWSHRHGPETPLAVLHERVARGLVEQVANWEGFL